MAVNNIQAPRDQNYVPAALFEIDGSPGQVMPGQIDELTGRILVDNSGGGGTTFRTDTFTSTNGQTAFTSSQNVSSTIYFSLNGSIQRPNSDYTVSGNTATLNNAIPSGVDVIWVYVTA